MTATRFARSQMKISNVQTDEKTSAVHFLRFELNPQQVAAT